MKLGIFIGVVIGFILVAASAAVVFATLKLPSTRESQNVIPTTIAQSTPLPSLTSPVPAAKPATSAAHIVPPVAGNSEVNFSAAINGISGTDLTSRTINAQLTNTGTADAHNVSARVDVTSQSSQIRLNGQNYLTQSFGTIKTGSTVAIQQTVSVSITDGLKILQNGATVILTISSDEKTQAVSYNYQP
jgi:archaellin